jgi:hypothetical protein
MKNRIFPVLSMILAFLSVAAFAHYTESISEGAALAAFVPLIPKNLFSGVGHSVFRAIRLNDGTWGPGGETLDYPIYDRLRMDSAQAVNVRSLFKTAVGTQREGITLTYADTNIEKSESIPSSQKWELSELRLNYLAVEPRTDAEIQLMLNYFRTTTFRCIINSKDDMFRLPLWKFFGSPQMVSAPAVTVNSRYPQAMFTGVMELKIPIVLESLTDWEVKVEPLVASDAALNLDFITFEF